ADFARICPASGVARCRRRLGRFSIRVNIFRCTILMTCYKGEAVPRNNASAADGHLAVGQTLHMPKMAELIGDALRRQSVHGALKEGDALPSGAVRMGRVRGARRGLGGGVGGVG